MLRITDLRLLGLLAVTAAFSMVLFASISSDTWASLDPLPAIKSYLRPSEPSRVLVGPRELGPFYYGRGCDSSQMLSAIARSRIREDGVSLKIPSPASIPEELDIDEFAVSFDLDGCPPIHHFTPAEACDLLGAYGGLAVSGDSFERHLTNAFFIVLTGLNSGALREPSESDRCRGEKTFIDQPAHCRNLVYRNSADAGDKLCGGNIFIQLDETNVFRDPATQNAMWDFLLSIVTPEKTSRSPILIANHGLHHGYNSVGLTSNYILPLVERYNSTLPRPVIFWAGNHAPGINKPGAWIETQGRNPTLAFNEAIGRTIDSLWPGAMVGANGMMKMVDFYNVTDGAESYDGTHYSFQVNIEKVLIFMNLLDVIWGEAKAGGGLLAE